MTTAALVPAAGSGVRLGPGGPKALRMLAGEPLLVHAVRALVAADIPVIVVAAPAADVDAVRELLDPVVGSARLHIVTGGDTRQQSVAQALAVLPPDVDIVLVHDAARPLVPPALVAAVAAAVRDGHDAVVPGIPVSDTVKRVNNEGAVVGTPDRAHLRAIQTPQGFRRSVLERAHATAGDVEATDDAALVERLGLAVHVVPGSDEAFKVTRPLDLMLAETLLTARRPA